MVVVLKTNYSLVALEYEENELAKRKLNKRRLIYDDDAGKGQDLEGLNIRSLKDMGLYSKLQVL